MVCKAFPLDISPRCRSSFSCLRFRIERCWLFVGATVVTRLCQTWRWPRDEFGAPVTRRTHKAKQANSATRLAPLYQAGAGISVVLVIIYCQISKPFMSTQCWPLRKQFSPSADVVLERELLPSLFRTFTSLITQKLFLVLNGFCWVWQCAHAFALQSQAALTSVTCDRAVFLVSIVIDLDFAEIAASESCKAGWGPYRGSRRTSR